MLENFDPTPPADFVRLLKEDDMDEREFAGVEGWSDPSRGSVEEARRSSEKGDPGEEDSITKLQSSLYPRQ